MAAESGCGSLCRRVGHDCDTPGADHVAPGWSAWDEQVLAAVGLLEFWLEESTATGGSRWRLAVTRRKPQEQPPPGGHVWTPDPSAAEITGHAECPRAFTGRGEDGRRYPRTAELLVAATDESTFARTDQLMVDEVARSLTGILDPDRNGLPTRIRLLVAEVAELLVRSRCHDVLRLGVAAQPDGAPIDGEWHLLFRHDDGGTTWLAMAPVPPADEEDTPRPDPACVLANHHGCVPLSGDDYRRAVRRTRMACTTALMSESLYLNNNDRMHFGVRIEPHHLDLPADPDAADREFRAWLTTSQLAMDLRDEGEWPEDTETYTGTRTEEDDNGMPVRLAVEGLDAFFSAVQEELVQGSIEISRWQEDSASTDPDDHLIAWLIRDFLPELTDRVRDTPHEAPRLAYARGLPFGFFTDEYASEGDDFGHLVLVGARRAVLLTIDARV